MRNAGTYNTRENQAKCFDFQSCLRPRLHRLCAGLRLSGERRAWLSCGLLAVARYPLGYESYRSFSYRRRVGRAYEGLDDTVRENIRMGRRDATDAEVEAAAKAACCDDFIESLPDGYATVIGEGGESLSGGEKQRISIARAMLKNVPIVILDEATANVDPENEDRLQKAIEALTRNKTIIMIAHRLKTVRRADQIIVIDHGRIVQNGRHEELVSVPGIYADFIGGKKETVDWKL